LATAFGRILLSQFGYWKRRVLQTAVNQQRARWGGKFSVSAHRATQAQVARFIRRNTDGVIAENYGKTRPPGDLRVALFPSKHSRVRIPSPALTARNKTSRPPIGGREASDSLSIKSRVFGIESLRSALLHVLARISRMTLLQGYESCARVTLFRVFPRSRLAEPHSPPAIARGKHPSQSTPSSDWDLGSS